MFTHSKKLPPVEERNESIMHKLAKEKLAEWLHTEDNYVVEEYPIIPNHCGTWDSHWVTVDGVGEQVKGGWYRGKTYDELLKNPILHREWNSEKNDYNPTKPLYPVAICDLFTYSSGKIPEAREIWEIRHTNSVTPAKRKAILDCYIENNYEDNTPPHFFEVDASAILNFDYKIKPKDALRALRLTLKDLNPMAELSEEEWQERFDCEDRIEYERELEKRFKESDEYKQHEHDVETRRQAKKEEVEQAMKLLCLDSFLNDVKEAFDYADLAKMEKKDIFEIVEVSLKDNISSIPRQISSWDGLEAVRKAWMAQNDKRLSVPTKAR
jgi:hypothetical protein